MSLSISIIIPSYNQGQFIEEAINSLLEQKYPSLEIIVIDGKSSDNTLNILERYSDRLTFWISEKDNGQSNAINKGLIQAKGEIISWLGSDDFLTTGSLNKINEVFSSHPDVDLIHGKSKIFIKDKILRIDAGHKNQSAERKLAGMTFPQPSAFFRKRILEKTGLLNEELNYGMDYDLFAKMSIIAKTLYVDFIFSEYRVHKESKTGSATEKFTADWIVVFNSVVSGLNYSYILEQLDKLDLNSKVLTPTYNFFQQNKPAKNISETKTLFYFLTNILALDYQSGNFKRASLIAIYLRKNFRSMLENEEEILKITNRLKVIPIAVIKLLRKILR